MAESRYDVLQTIVDEFKTLSPETTNALVFDAEGKTILTTKTTGLDQRQNLFTNFAAINSQAKTIGGLENLTIQASNSQLSITVIEQLFLATVSSRKANPKVLKSLTKVVVPTMVSLLNQTIALPSKTELHDPLNPEKIEEPAPVSQVTPEIESIPEPSLPFETFMPETPESQNVDLPSQKEVQHLLNPEEIKEPALSEEASEIETILESTLPFEAVAAETSGHQLVIEKISDSPLSPDTVRIDGEVVAKWFSLSGGKRIRLVTIETSEGRKTICKFKPMDELFKRKFGVAAVTIRRKDAKSSTKGIIQVPEKIILALQTNKGNLVKVKPVIDQPEE